MDVIIKSIIEFVLPLFMQKYYFSREQLESLYLKGVSMRVMAEMLDCSEHVVVYWMEKYGISRRSRSEAIYLHSNPEGDPFSIKKKLSVEDAFLYGLGVGLFWGEGTKVAPNSVRIANGDPGVILLFRKFLLEICGVKREKLRYGLVCFQDTDPGEVGRYWANQLQISPKKFGKIVRIPAQGKGTYKRKSLHGVCTLMVGNIKLKQWIMVQIENARARVV